MDSKAAGVRVATLRMRRGWSARELARRARLSPSWVSDFERGLMENPRDLSLQAVASALGWTSWEELLASPALEPTAQAIATGESVAELRERLDRLERQVQQRPIPGTVAPRQHDTRRPHPGDWRPALRSVYGTETLVNVESFTDRDEPRVPPAGYENQLPEGYALLVKGDSLSGLPRPIHDGDWVWIDPIQHGERTEWPGRPHVALVRHTPGSDPVAVVKVLKGDGLYSVLRRGDGMTNEVRLDVAEILAITPVIAVERSSDP